MVPTLTLPKFRLLGVTDITVPWPVTSSFCGLPTPLSVTSRVAERRPDAEGVKATLIVQLAPAATLDPQVFVSAKSAALGPASLIPLIVRVLLPVLVRVTGCEGLVVLTS